VAAGAQRGDARSQFEYAVALEKGLRSTADPEQALEWMRKSAEGGYAPAQYEYARLLDQLRPNSKAESVAWLIKSAEAGDCIAMAELGMRYANGQTVAQDTARGLDLLRRAAIAKNDYACYHLGCVHLDGIGVAKNPVEGFAWMLLAANSKDAELVKFKDERQAALTPEQRTAAQARSRELRSQMEYEARH
jgi:TPR repeat protein